MGFSYFVEFLTFWEFIFLTNELCELCIIKINFYEHLISKTKKAYSGFNRFYFRVREQFSIKNMEKNTAFLKWANSKNDSFLLF